MSHSHKQQPGTQKRSAAAAAPAAAEMSDEETQDRDAKVSSNPETFSDASDDDGADDRSKPKETPSQKWQRESKEIVYVSRDLKYTYTREDYQGLIVHQVLEGKADEKTLPFKPKEGKRLPKKAPTNGRDIRRHADLLSEERFTKADFYPETMTRAEVQKLRQKQRAAANPQKTKEDHKKRHQKYHLQKGYLSKDLECFIRLDKMGDFDFNDPTTFPFKEGEQVQYKPSEFYEEPVTESQRHNFRTEKSTTRYWVLEKKDPKTGQRLAIKLIGKSTQNNIEQLKEEALLTKPEGYELTPLAYGTYKNAKNKFADAKAVTFDEAGKVHPVARAGGGSGGATIPMSWDERRAHNARIERQQLFAVDETFQILDGIDINAPLPAGVFLMNRSKIQNGLRLIGGDLMEDNPYVLIEHNATPKNIVKVFENTSEALTAKKEIQQDEKLSAKFKVIRFYSMKRAASAASRPSESPAALKELQTKKRSNALLGGIRKVYRVEDALLSEETKLVLYGKEQDAENEAQRTIKAAAAAGCEAKSNPPNTSDEPPLKRPRIVKTNEATAAVKLTLPTSARKKGAREGERLALLSMPLDQTLLAEKAKIEAQHSENHYIESANLAYAELNKKLNAAAVKGQEEGEHYARTVRVMPTADSLFLTAKRGEYGPAYDKYLQAYLKGAAEVISNRAKDLGKEFARRDVCRITQVRDAKDQVLAEEAAFYQIDHATFISAYQEAFPVCKMHRDNVIAAKKIRDAKDPDMIKLRQEFQLTDLAILTSSPFAREEMEAIHGFTYKAGFQSKHKFIIDQDPELPGHYGLFAGEDIPAPNIVVNKDGTIAPDQLLKLLLIEYTGSIMADDKYHRASNSADFGMTFEQNNKRTIVDATLYGCASRFVNHIAEASRGEAKEIAETKANTFYLEFRNKCFVAQMPGRGMKKGQRVGAAYHVPPLNAIPLSTQQGLKKQVRKAEARVSQLGHFGAAAAAATPIRKAATQTSAPPQKNFKTMTN